MQKFIQFFLVFLVSWSILSLFGVGTVEEKKYTDDIVFFAENEYQLGASVKVTILNNMDKGLSIENECKKTPLVTEKYNNGKWELIKTDRKKGFDNCKNPVIIPPHEKRLFSYEEESYALFGQEGKYRINIQSDSKLFSHEFYIVAPGFFKTLWNILIYKPILNLLVFLIEVSPGHSLGIAVIILTIIIKVLLLVPNHKALKSQKALQKIQPKIQAIKEKYKDDQAKLAQETMALWKKHKVNPAGACLPILLQFPFLIAIFFVIQNGLSENNIYLLYENLKNFDYNIIQPMFLYMDLTDPGTVFLGATVGILQYFQMKLSFKNQQQNNTQSITELAEKGEMMQAQMQMMTKTFTYVLPVFIFIFIMTLPGAVGLYWGVSTVFAVVQQQVINKPSQTKEV